MADSTGDIDYTEDGEHLTPQQPQDNDTPFSQPTDPISDAAADVDVREQSDRLDDTHQVTDTNVDSHETYDEGLSGAAEAEEPNAGNSVTGYTPPDDQQGS
jgi:hypothetical protein